MFAGGAIGPGRSPERGFLPIAIDDGSDLFRGLPQQVVVFQDHGDEVDGPPGGVSGARVERRLPGAGDRGRGAALVGHAVPPGGVPARAPRGRARAAHLLLARCMIARWCRLSHERTPRRLDRRAAREAAAVLVEGGRIARVGAASDAPPEGATIVDLAGRTLLPGLVDAHVHVTAFEMPTPMKGEAGSRPRSSTTFSPRACARCFAWGSRRCATSARSATTCCTRGARSSSARSPARACSRAEGSSRRPRPAARTSRTCTAKPTARTRCARRRASRSAAAPTSSS